MTTESIPLDHDLACCRCDYNLRGLASDGRCPECGTEIRQSIQHAELTAVERRWVRQVHIAIQFVTCSAIVFAAMPCAVGFAVFGLFGFLTLLPGLFLLGQPAPPSIPVPQRVRRHCVAAACGLIAGIVALVLLIAGSGVGIGQAPLLDNARICGLSFVLACLGVGLRAQALVAAPLAQRAGKVGLVGGLRGTARLGGVIAGLSVVAPLGLFINQLTAVGVLLTVLALLWIWAISAIFQCSKLLAALDKWVYPHPDPLFRENSNPAG